MADAGNVKVAVRCRPFNKREKDLNSKPCIVVDTEMHSVEIHDAQKGKDKKFTFDFSYWMDCKQEEVYDDVARPLTLSALDGYNGTIFAYGQTGSGKSWSMMGDDEGNFPGIIPRVNTELFKLLKEKESEEQKFMVTVSYLEIYKEVIRDLLNPTDKELKIREHPDMGIYVDGLGYWRWSLGSARGRCTANTHPADSATRLERCRSRHLIHSLRFGAHYA